MAVMPRVRATSLLAAITVAGTAVGAGGCQTFIGVEDVNAHLPRLDGTYLLAIRRTRRADGVDDVIQARALVSLDPESRTLDVSFVILGFNSDTAVAEGSITGIEFPPTGAETVFAFNLQIPSGAVRPPALSGPDQVIDVPEMLLRAEAAYSFCARPDDTEVAMPTFGTVLVAPGAALPTGDRVDTSCDDEP